MRLDASARSATRQKIGGFRNRIKRIALKAGFVISGVAQVWHGLMSLSAQIQWGGLGFITLAPYVSSIIGIVMSIVGYRMVDKLATASELKARAAEQ